MVMIAILFIRAFTEQEMIIAKLELLQFVKIIARNALEVEPINTLAIFIPFHGLWGGCTRHLGPNDLEIRRLGFICHRGQWSTQI